MINGFAPFMWIALAAILVLLPGLVMLFGKGGPRDARGRKLFRVRPLRRLCGLSLVCLGCVSGLLALTLVQFYRLTSDEPVAHIQIRQEDDGRFQLTAQPVGASERHYTLSGDQWQIDARVVRWRLPALMAGVPPLYRLERLSGRYSDVEKERSESRSVYSLDDWAAPDLVAFKQAFPDWLPFVDVQFGSGAYMPLFDGASFQVYLDPRGALFIRPDSPETQAGLKRLGW